MIRAARMLLAGLLLAGVSLAQAAEGTLPAGSWKIKLPFLKDIGDKSLWLVKLENKDGKWSGSVLGKDEGMPPATLDNLSVTKDLLRFSLKSPGATFPLEFNLPKEKTAKLHGILKRGGGVTAAEMEQTTLTSLNPIELLKETFATGKDNATITRVGLNLLSVASETKAKPEEVRSWAARTVKVAEAYSPRWQRDVILLVVEILTKQKGYESIALTYARQAERLLDDKDRPSLRMRVLNALAEALTRAGKADEAKEVKTRAKKIDYTIKPEPFAGRRSNSDSVVLVELFTGAQCPPCVAADLAFDALSKTFKPSEVVRLQYHLHIPGPDPLTNPDSEARSEFYGRFVRGTPTVLVNGKPVGPGGGGPEEGWDKYDEYVDGVLPLLEKSAKVKLKGSATRRGDKIILDVRASEVEQREGDDFRLRLALIEKQVAYTGGNKVAEHHHVVRAFPGGVKGEKFIKGKPLTKMLTVDLAEVRKGLREYLDKVNKVNPFPNKDRPLDLKNLHVVAFVQNDATREVLQVIQIDVPE